MERYKDILELSFKTDDHSPFFCFDVFSGGWVGPTQKRRFDVLRDKLGMDVAPKLGGYLSHIKKNILVSLEAPPRTVYMMKFSYSTHSTVWRHITLKQYKSNVPLVTYGNVDKFNFLSTSQ